MELTNRIPDGAEECLICLDYAHKLAQKLADKGFQPVEFMACKVATSLAEDTYTAAVGYFDKWGVYSVQGFRDTVEREQKPNLGSPDAAVAQALAKCKARRRKDRNAPLPVFEEVPEGETVH